MVLTMGYTSNNPSYQAEIVKLRLLYNSLIETGQVQKDKFDIQAAEEINFHLGIGELQDNVAIKAIFLKKNFLISEDRNLLSGTPPSRVIGEQRVPLKIDKGANYSKDKFFGFNVVVEDTSSNISSGLLIPSFFWTRVEQPN